MNLNLRLPVNKRIKYIVRILFIMVFSFCVGMFLRADNYGLMNAFIAALGFVLTFIPKAVENITKRKIRFSATMECAIIIFIFAAQILGEIGSFYERFPWWDTMLHASSGVMLALIGFMIVTALNEYDRSKVHLSPLFVAMFAFSFALSLGALWEIFEFCADRFLGTDMQKYLPPNGVTALKCENWKYDAGLVDTMCDLIVDAVSALIISLGGFIKLVRKDRKA
ncbi:MAG: hypothetical protein Q8882_03200 [Bacillota bacterium]|nr:hypothetical protein [Bacillota bacterium]